jgi:photosystem II stability/assembly factor-like uncharacterized protein
MTKYLVLTLYLSLWAIVRDVSAQWNIVREQEQSDGRHTYLSLTTSDGMIIYACGAVQNITDEYTIEKSTNGGHSWVRQGTIGLPQLNVSLNNKFHGIKTLDGINAIVISDSGLIVTTNDGGESWVVRNYGSRFNLFDVDVNSSGTAVVTGNYGTLGISNDTGRTWQFKELIDSTTFTTCKIFGKDTIYLIDKFYANFFRSFDGGETWDSVKYYPIPFDGNKGAQVFDAFFWDSREGLIVGLNKDIEAGSQVFNNFIARTTNAGESWSIVMDTLLPFTNGLLGVHFSDHSRGIIGTRGSNILLTSDGGYTWRQDSINIGEQVRGSFGALATKDEYLVIAKDVQGYGIITLYHPKKEIVDSFLRSSDELIIFPNPTSSQITFECTACLKLSIQDDLGKEMFFVNSPNSLFDYDCNRLVPGLYFVHCMQSNGIRISSKFIKR